MSAVSSGENTNTDSETAPAGSTEDQGPSKSQAKRDAAQVRELGSALAALSDSERSRIPLDEDVRNAIDEFNHIRPGANGARKRQLGYLAKKLRQTDLEPIEQAVEAIRQTARAATADLHLVEAWRDRPVSYTHLTLPTNREV